MSYKFYLLPTLLLALTGCAGQGDSTVRLPWWGWLILILALAVVVWLLIRAQRVEEQKAESVEPDNLTLIEGIGPRIQSVLQAVGIHTFEQLADLAPEKIKEVLTEAGVRLAVTDTWPKQAKLAAQGKMDELKALQDELQGGRMA
ncbi:MAG: DUF4332 domain-containing protein [Chloroflexota bacterium]|nr:DUF4332 domain-containing protein [Chloroflexota bacterium]